MNSLEVESTYLVKRLPDNLDQYPHEHILQGYISQGNENLRIRKKSKKYELTKKFPVNPGDFSQHNESTIILNETEFNKLWPLVERRYERVRYYIPLNDTLTAELDVFQGSFEGFNLVDVEFPNSEEQKSFVKPDWFGDDVTQFGFFSEPFISTTTWAQIKPLFEEFLGKKL